MVTDEVWAELDPHAGRLSGRGVAVVWLAVFAALTLSLVSAATSYDGLVVSQLNAQLKESPPHTPDVDPYVVTPGRITLTVVLRNDGKVPVTVIALGSRARPLVSPVTWPIEIAPGRQIEVRLAYEIPDCGRFPTGPYTFPIEMRHWWGTEHRSIELFLGLAQPLDPAIRHACQPVV